jgi:hypothetical protein
MECSRAMRGCDWPHRRLRTGNLTTCIYSTVVCRSRISIARQPGIGIGQVPSPSSGSNKDKIADARYNIGTRGIHAERSLGLSLCGSACVCKGLKDLKDPE